LGEKQRAGYTEKMFIKSSHLHVYAVHGKDDAIPEKYIIIPKTI
jgi:3-methyladenine DNA glycosylase Mpg